MNSINTVERLSKIRSKNRGGLSTQKSLVTLLKAV